MKRPLVPVCLSLVCGIVAADLIQSLVWIVFILIVLIILTLSLKFENHIVKGIVIASVIFFMAGYFFHSWNMYSIYTQFSQWDNEKVTVTGIIVSNPVAEEEGLSCTIKTESVSYQGENVEARGKMNLNIYIEELNDLSYGDRIEIEGKLRKPDGKRNPGGFDYRKYLASRRISATINVYNNDFAALPGKQKIFFIDWGYRLQNSVIDIIEETMPQQQAGLLNGMLIGYRQGLNDDVEAAFRDAGLTHIMAVSGANVAFLLLPLLFIFKKLRIKKWLGNLFSMVFLLIFICITGFEASVLRAAAMAGVMLLGQILGRDTDIYQSLSISAIILLLINSFLLFNVGFQLSYAATLFLVLLYKKVKELLPSKTPGWLSDTFSGTVAAQLGVLPLLARYFNRISIISLVSNLIVIPCTGLITIVGFIMVIAGQVSILPARILAYPLCSLLSFVLYVTDITSSLPFAAVRVYTPKPYMIIIFYLVLFLAAMKIRNRKKVELIIGMIMLGGLIFITGTLVPRPLKVTFIDVGQGDSILINTPDMKNILIDGGGSSRDEETLYTGDRIVVPFLLNQGVRQLDAVIVTHEHIDHMNGLKSVLRDFKVKKLIISNTSDEELLKGLIDAALTENIPIFKADNSFKNFIDSDSKLSILYPVENMTNSMSANNHSIVCALEYKNARFLFTGDAELESEEILLDTDQELQSDVLKVGHHGGSSSTSFPFLEKCRPQIAVICVGDNSYGHPSEKVIERLEQYRAEIYETLEDGAVIIRTYGEKYRVSTTVREDVFLFTKH